VANYSDASKSRRKRERHALQDLGRELVALSERQLDELGLPDEVLEPIREARKLQRGALQRQMRYVAARLATVDAQAVRADLERMLQPSRREIARFHEIERWRDRLLGDGEGAAEAAMTEFLTAHPDADAERLRRLVRNAAIEATSGRPPKSARELFSRLRDLLDPGR
jgi:ribosome-associated protein